MAKDKVVPRKRKSLLTITATPCGQRSPALPIVATKTEAAAPLTAGSAMGDAWAYQTGFWRQPVRFLDTLRERAKNMLAHRRAGLPPLLNFDYETILDARRFEHAANCALLRITGPGSKRMEECVDENARPVLIIDPRMAMVPGSAASDSMAGTASV